MSKSDAGKGDRQRPRLVPELEYALRWEYAQGRIDEETFEKELDKLKRK